MAKKKYVLWVVHTDLDIAGLTEDEEISHRHIDAVIRTMKEAQEAGIPIFYEYKRGGFANGFLDMAKANGIRRINKFPYFEDKERDFDIREGKWAVNAFLKLMRTKGLTRNFEVLLCGHYISDCIEHRAVALKERGIKPLLVGGLASILMVIGGGGMRGLKKLYGKNGIIPVDKIKELW